MKSRTLLCLLGCGWALAAQADENGPSFTPGQVFEYLGNSYGFVSGQTNAEGVVVDTYQFNDSGTLLSVNLIGPAGATMSQALIISTGTDPNSSWEHVGYYVEDYQGGFRTVIPKDVPVQMQADGSTFSTMNSAPLYVSIYGDSAWKVALMPGGTQLNYWAPALPGSASDRSFSLYQSACPRFSGDVSGWFWNGQWLVNPPASDVQFTEPDYGGTLGFLGSTFTLMSQSSGQRYECASGEKPTLAGCLGQNYSDLESGGSLSIQQDCYGTGGSGYAPYIGSFHFTGPTASPSFDPISSPTFYTVKRTFWVNGKLVNFVQGILDAGGGVTDIYASQDGQVQLRVAANVRAFKSSPVEDLAAAAQVRVNGAITGSFTRATAGEITAASNGDYDIQVDNPTSPSPHFCSSPVLYVNRRAFAFQGGWADSHGHRVDSYACSTGFLMLKGSASGTAAAAVSASLDTVAYTGTYQTGAFAVPPLRISSNGPLDDIAGLWVDGSFCARTSDTASFTYVSTAGDGSSLTLHGPDLSTVSVTGTVKGETVTGAYNAVQGGGIALVRSDGTGRFLAFPAEANGTLQSGGAAVPASYPPAVKVDADVFNWMGQLQDDAAGATSGTTVLCYAAAWNAGVGGHASAACKLLKITPAAASAETASVALRDKVSNVAVSGMVYRPASHLFQIGSVTLSPPQAVFAVDPAANYAQWLLQPASGSKLPPTFIIRGKPWWYAGTSGGTATYLGFYNGQQMTLGAADAVTGIRPITLNDPLNNSGAAAHGSLSDVRGSARLRDGTLVLSGTPTGTQQTVTVTDDYKLHTIASDVDIIGNNLSFGVLKDDASLAAVLFSFADGNAAANTPATLRHTLSRAQAEWVWQNTVDSSALTTRDVMKLDKDHRLKLFPATGNAEGITLDPGLNGVSSLRGVLRVRPGGDIDMGGFTAGGEP